jgi:hypothetical protein
MQAATNLPTQLIFIFSVGLKSSFLHIGFNVSVICEKIPFCERIVHQYGKSDVMKGIGAANDRGYLAAIRQPKRHIMHFWTYEKNGVETRTDAYINRVVLDPF